MSHRFEELPERRPEPRPPAAPQPTRPYSAAAILALQGSAGNQAVARMLNGSPLQREPAPPGAAPATGAAPAPETGIVPMLEAFWPDTLWSQGRLALDMLRPIPAFGLLTGLAADVMGAWDDFSAVPTGDPVLAGLNYVLLTFRSGLNIVVNGAQGLLQINQTMQLGNTVQAGVEFLSGVGAPMAIIDSAQAVRDFLAGSGLSVFIAALDGGLLAIDGLIMLEAGLWGQIGPVDDRAKWKELAWGYLANAIGDLVTLPVAVAGFASLNFLPSGLAMQGIDSATALGRHAVRARSAILSTLQSFWNVRGGNVLPRIPGPGPAPEEGLKPTEPQPGAESPFGGLGHDAADPSWAAALAAAEACYERGENVLGEAASDWAELLANGGAMAEGAAGAPEALEALRQQLPEYATEMQARLATVEELAGQLDGGLETLDALGGQMGEMLTAVEGLALPLDEVPEPLRTTLEPVAAALEDAKSMLLGPLSELQATLTEVRPQLEAVAAAARDTVAILNEGIDRVADAAAHCDDISEFVNDVAALPAALASGEASVSIGDTLADWLALGPDVEAAKAAI